MINSQPHVLHNYKVKVSGDYYEEANRFPNFECRQFKIKIKVITTMMFYSIVFWGNLHAMSQGQSNMPEPLILSRINGPIVIDGLVEDPAWDFIESLPMVSYEPVAGLPPSESTEIRIAYDDYYIYASIRAYDSDPSGIRINSLYRDRMGGSDLFHILLDTYNDNETAMVFAVNPAGVKFDAIVSKDAVPVEGRDPVNLDYDTFWDVKTSVDDRGWFAEIRIPFSRIGFQDIDGKVVMGLNVQRMIARKNERVLFPGVPVNTPNAYYKSTLAQKVVFEGIYSNRPLYITPYVTGGMDRKNVLKPDLTGFSTSNSKKLEGGFDLRYGISNNFNLDVTLNTDFAQVEADNQQVNLTRFNLFFPEKRQFFQGRSSIFEFNTGGDARLFYSRRIGLTSTGDQVRILGGARLTGRVGSWDIGILNMQTGSINDDPAENFGVVRLRRRIFNPYSYAGVMGTSRINMNGDYNFGYGTDGTLRLAADDYFTWVWAQTIEEESSSQPLFDNSRIRLAWFRQTREGFSWETTYSRTGESYNPAAGFNARRNYYYMGQTFKYGWMSAEKSFLLWHSLRINSAFFRSLTTGLIETGSLGSRWDATTKLGHKFNSRVDWYYEDIPVEFPLLGRTVIEPGKYRFLRGAVGYEMASSRLLRTRVEADIGTFYDGWRFTMDMSPIWNVSKHLELQLSWLYNLISVPMSGGWFSEQVGQLRVNTALNTHLSTNAFIQMNTSADLISANIRFRYNFRDGNDLWIVLNEGMNTDLQRFDPFLPRTESRTLLVKYTYTFHK